MLKRIVFLVVVFTLAGCSSMTSAPIGEERVPVRIEAPLPGAAVPAATPSSDRFYVVKKGDTLYNIALNHGVTSRDLAAWNNLDNSSRITIGQRLRVNAPAPAGTAGMPAPGSAEVQAIALGGPVVGRPLDGAVSPAPTFAPGGGEAIKTSPKGGKLPYSEANLALLKAQQGPAATPVAPTAEEKPAAPPAPPVVSPAPVAPGDIDWAWRLRKLGWKQAVLRTDKVVHDNKETLSKWSHTRVFHLHKARLQLIRRHRRAPVFLVKAGLMLRHLGELLGLALLVHRPKLYLPRLKKRWALLTAVPGNYEN